MKALHAQYPFLVSSREAVGNAEIDLAELVSRDDQPVVERALARVESALTETTIGETNPSPRVELLSYPVARVLVSLVEERIVIRRYARAEAMAAHERFTAEFDAGEPLKSARGERLSLADLLAEFDLQNDIREIDDDEYHVDVGVYLPLAADAWGEEWRLVNRALFDGAVPVDRTELCALLRQAVKHRVEEGLPFAVPDEVAEPLADEVAHLREVLADLELIREIDTVVPDLFPPCMKHLIDQIQKGEHLAHHSRFAITAFLASIGMTTDDIVELYRVNSSFGEEMTRYQTDHIRGDRSPTEYSPPSCATMKSYGDCVNMDDLCETISHPLAYYERTLDAADEDDLTDWREERAEAEN